MRASVYRSLKETPPNTIAGRPGPVGACSDAELAEHIRQHIAASRLHGEGYRKLWARLRFAGVRTSPRRVRRVMRENGLRRITLDAPRPSHTMARSSPIRSMKCGEQT
jgi:putative transposase